MSYFLFPILQNIPTTSSLLLMFRGRLKIDELTVRRCKLLVAAWQPFLPEMKVCGRYEFLQSWRLQWTIKYYLYYWGITEGHIAHLTREESEVGQH